MHAPRNVLGLSAYYHDSAAALLVDGNIIAAAQEERFTRKKNDSDFPANAVQFCLHQANLNESQLDLFFIFILTPAGWILRLAGKDLLQLKRPADATTFWQTAKDASPLHQLF